MCSLTSNFQALVSLQEIKEGAKKCEQPIFETWSLENYGQCIKYREQRVGRILTRVNPFAIFLLYIFSAKPSGIPVEKFKCCLEII